MRRVAVGAGLAVVAAFAVAVAGFASPTEIGVRIDVVAAERRSSRRSEVSTPATELMARLPPEQPTSMLAVARTTAPAWARALVWSLGGLLVLGGLARLVLLGGLVLLVGSGLRDRRDAHRPDPETAGA